MNFLNFEESKQELRRLYKENKSLKEENEKLRAESIGYWLEISSTKRENGEFEAEIERLAEENKKLKIELEHLKEPKAIINVNVTAEDLAKEVARALNKDEDKEHKCTQECFGKHVIKAIQNDYDSHGRKFRERFLRWWFFNLKKEYHWLESMYIIDEKIYFKSKRK